MIQKLVLCDNDVIIIIISHQHRLKNFFLHNIYSKNQFAKSRVQTIWQPSWRAGNLTLMEVTCFIKINILYLKLNYYLWWVLKKKGRSHATKLFQIIYGVEAVSITVLNKVHFSAINRYWFQIASHGSYFTSTVTLYAYVLYKINSFPLTGLLKILQILYF